MHENYTMLVLSITALSIPLLLCHHQPFNHIQQHKFLIYPFTLAMAIQMLRTSFTLSRASLIDKNFFYNIGLINKDLLLQYAFPIVLF